MRALAGPVLAAGVAFGFQALAQEGTAKPEAPVVKQVTAGFPKGDRLEARIMTATIQLGMTSPWHTHPSLIRLSRSGSLKRMWRA